jgi:glutamate--cysteine ligase
VSQDRPEQSQARPVESVDELVAHLRAGEKPPERWLVGTEHEKIGLYEDSYDPVPYEGPRGIGAVLQRVAEVDAWQPLREGPNVVGLEKGGASITLEPGGQLELSGAPLRTIHETCDEFHAHLALMKRISRPMRIAWLGLGIHPLHGVDRIPVMPKARYRIMRSYLPTRGALALEMMFATATVQANFDYSDETDMCAKLRTALAVSPIVSAIFANSSVSEGKANGFITRRLHIWANTDPDRCGLLPFAFEAGFGYREYVEWALDVPLFFLVRGGTYRPAHTTTFRRFLQEGFEGERPTLADFDRHLTTLFPDVRLKRGVIEVRGADAVPPGLTCSLPALWKGLLYDADARAQAFGLVSSFDADTREAARADVARRGLGARYGDLPMRELAQELARISRAGLARLAHAGRRDADETGFLEPISAQLRLGASPGRLVAQRWEGEWGRSVDRLIEYARY